MNLKDIRLLVFTSLMLATGTVAAPMPPPEGFRGTPFRGVAIGDSQQAVDAALVGIGLRCLTPDEIQQLVKRQTPLLKPLDNCRIVPADFDLSSEVVSRHYFEQIAFPEWQSGTPLYQIAFVNGHAAALYLLPAFFNAGDLTPGVFAQSLVDNYRLPKGLLPSRSGWTGFTDKDEMITLLTSRDQSRVFMQVTLPSPKDRPAFN